MVPPFFFMVHIGKLIELEMQRQGRTVSWLASKLFYERTNIYSIFKRESIDSQLLLRISKLLNHNFFKYYINEYECKEKNKD